MTESASETAMNEARELDYRSNDGVEVALLWYGSTNRLTVSVRDVRADEAFEFAVDSANALDAFNHPYAYAAFHGIRYRAAARRANEPVSLEELVSP
jgi:hypothetical protein